MDYVDLADGQFLVDGGSLPSHLIQQQMNQQLNQGQFDGDQKDVGSSADEYRYSDILSKAFKQYSSLGNLMVKKDAAITFTTIASIGVTLLCISSFVVKLLFLAVATVLSFDIELQIPCASILLALFVFRESCIGVSKALLLFISLVVLVYVYWSDCLSNYVDVIWWMNIFLIALWAWMIFTSADSDYYSRIIEFRGGNNLDTESPYDSITEFDNMN